MKLRTILLSVSILLIGGAIFALRYWSPGFNDRAYDLGESFKVVVTSPLEHWIARNGVPVVPNLVFDFAYDAKFIVAGRLKTIEYLCAGARPFDAYFYTEEIEYWLIDKKSGNSFNTLSSSEFESERKRVGVPDALRIDVFQKDGFVADIRSKRVNDALNSTDCSPLKP